MALLVFGAGFVSAATGLFIPGNSGSMVLLLLGMCSTLLAAVRSFNLPLLLVLGAGAFTGFLIFSHLMNYLLTNFRRFTYLVIIGLLLGSAVKIWPGLSPGLQGVISIIVLGAGFFTALFFQSRTGEKREPSV